MDALETWDKIVKFYRDTWGYTPKMVDYLACRNIIKEHCKGLSIQRIASRTDTKERDVRMTLHKYMGFDGWEIDLDFSPLAVYNITKGIEKEYMDYITYNVEREYNYYMMKLSYVSCTKLYRMEEQLNGYN